MDRRTLVYFLVALHPLWLLGRALPGALFRAELQPGVFFVLPVGEVAYAVDLFVGAALLALLPGRNPAHTTSRKPFGVEQTMSGFSVVLRGTRSIQDDLLNAVLGLLASTVGFGLTFTIAVAMRPELYPVEHIHPVLFVIVGTVLHLSAQLFTLAPVTAVRMFLGRRSLPVTLAGRVLRVGAGQLTLTGTTRIDHAPGALLLADGGDRLTIRGPGESLAWIAEHLARIEPRGDEDAVPQAIDAVRRAAES